MAYLLTQLLSKSAKQYPDKAAVWAQGGAITYRELEERSNQLAHLLRERGLKSGDRVGIYMPKSVESVISMFATLKAGGIYVPLDPQAPAQRIAYIIGDCGIKALISNADKVKGLEALGKSCVDFNILTANGNHADGGLSVSMPWAAISEFPASHPPVCPRISTDLAYILYTSGSTGRPKGVMLSHLNALTFIDWCTEIFQIRTEDRLTNHAPLHFDLSVFDIYDAIQAGATVYLLPDQVALFDPAFFAVAGAHAYKTPRVLQHLQAFAIFDQGYTVVDGGNAIAEIDLRSSHIGSLPGPSAPVAGRQQDQGENRQHAGIPGKTKVPGLVRQKCGGRLHWLLLSI